ncbi:tetratricopeptide repeat protein 38-like [Orbicella faveolata]|uniref:tetratricopeptide repeat protein 38-like n=1 Tax=Orbicella faveolata TaxID=48498 RepID=UPI0009E23036|nr:tetratricopeptide repeat protein 38-like [Orbicella faveolata]
MSILFKCIYYLQAWRKEGLLLSTTSNEAAKMFDATISQVVAHLEDDTVGGLETSVTRMLEADPNFLMGHVLANEIQIKDSMDVIQSLAADNDLITDRERLHAEAAIALYAGKIPRAQDIWDEIVVAYPTDIFALKMLTDYGIFFGPKDRIRDSVARVFPHWKKEMPLYGYLFGLHAFGLEETRVDVGDRWQQLCQYWESHADDHFLGLELVPTDTWATHALTHVMEMEGRQDEGIEFLSKTMDNWKPCESLTCHNFWHWALYYVEKGDYESALNIYDTEIAPRFKKSQTFPLTDGSSLLYRLKFEGTYAFNDSHMLMSTLGAQNEDLTMKVLDSLRKFVRDGSGPNCEVSREVGLAVCEAFVEADKGNFDKAVEILKPLRYRLDLLGGSRAQRDVYELFLINAAMQSQRKEDHQYVRCLLAERKAKKDKAPMTDRLMAKALALQVD